jgi:hypothetical protein
MEGLDARAVLANGAEQRAAEDLQRATHEWWRFTTTSVLQLGLMVQEHELAGLASWISLHDSALIYDVRLTFRTSLASPDGEPTANGRAARATAP